MSTSCHHLTVWPGPSPLFCAVWRERVIHPQHMKEESDNYCTVQWWQSKVQYHTTSKDLLYHGKGVIAKGKGECSSDGSDSMKKEQVMWKESRSAIKDQRDSEEQRLQYSTVYWSKWEAKQYSLTSTVIRSKLNLSLMFEYTVYEWQN